MSVELIWHPQAREDLRDIYATIGFASPDAAERLYTSIEAKADMLVHYPRLGRRRPDIRPGTRVLIEGRYLILYETHPDTDEPGRPSRDRPRCGRPAQSQNSVLTVGNSPTTVSSIGQLGSKLG
jgi:toxin ParE1/3/4